MRSTMGTKLVGGVSMLALALSVFSVAQLQKVDGATSERAAHWRSCISSCMNVALVDRMIRQYRLLHDRDHLRSAEGRMLAMRRRYEH